MTATYELFNLALITGGGGGLGKALARNFIKHGKQVIIAGRTSSTLESTQKELGDRCIATYVVDVAQTSSLPAFVQTVLSDHPKLDCVVNNAGILKLLDFKQGGLEVDNLAEEVNININAVTVLCNLFSPHLQQQPSSVLANLTSGLAYVPSSKFPIYCATKAFVASFTRSLRVQLKDTSVRVVEICPPLVDSNMAGNIAFATTGSRERNPMALTQEQFIAEVEAGLASDAVDVGAGSGIERLNLWKDSFGPWWKRVNSMQ